MFCLLLYFFSCLSFQPFLLNMLARTIGNGIGLVNKYPGSTQVLEVWL